MKNTTEKTKPFFERIKARIVILVMVCLGLGCLMFIDDIVSSYKQDQMSNHLKTPKKENPFAVTLESQKVEL